MTHSFPTRRASVLLGVEGPEGLVEEEHVRLRSQRPGDGHTLAHAPRQLPREEVGGVGEAHDAEELLDPFGPLRLGVVAALEAEGDRSEEHTSELQSLMRISYAVFCLKKKKK